MEYCCSSGVFDVIHAHTNTKSFSMVAWPCGSIGWAAAAIFILAACGFARGLSQVHCINNTAHTCSNICIAGFENNNIMRQRARVKEKKTGR